MPSVPTLGRQSQSGAPVAPKGPPVYRPVVNAPGTLASIAKTIHVGSLSQSTTGIARLKSGKLVAATQAPVRI